MIEQLIFHLIGDYVTQNNWMANNKTARTVTGFVACYIHCILYSLPFLYWGITTWAIVFNTHFLIDRYRLANYVCSLKNGRWLDVSNSGFPPETPAFISTWVMIIVDNTMHICCNYIPIRYF